MKSFEKFKITIVLLIAAFSLASAQVNVKIAFDSTAILVGDQIFFTIHIEQPKDLKVELPAFQDSIVKNIEVLQSLPADTSFLNAQTIAVNKKYLITSFDSGDYKIDFLKFIYFKGAISDSAFSNATMLYVRALPIKDPDKIADIKNVIDIPITFKEILPYAASGLGGLLLIAFLAYAYYRWKNKKSVFGFSDKPTDPPHVVAFRELEKLKSEKLWQQGMIKQYYSRLTDILRLYIETRLQIPALESTSDEIIAAIQGSELVDVKLKSDLKEMLSLADLVKFAKAEPLPDENEQAWQFANDFVVNTFRDRIEEPVDENQSEETDKIN